MFRFTLKNTLFAIATMVLSGCAGAGDQGAPPATLTANMNATTIGPHEEQVRIRDPIAELDASRSTPPSGGRYQRFETAQLDGLSEFWNRPRMDAWNAWAIRHLQDGDLVFIQSKGNMILGVIDFSQLTRDVTESPFTHMGVVAIEGGQAVVYDTVVAGPGRKTFGQMMALPDIVGVAVKRLRPEYQQHIPGALTYCRRVYEQQIGFDKKLHLDNNELYCTELLEVAFRSTGLQLSQPVRWDALPGFSRHPVSINAIRIANQAQPSDYVVIPGNEEMGIWANSALELVLDLTDVESPPDPS